MGLVFSGGITGEAVDLGCGDGLGIEIFCNDYPNLNWTGIDSSSFAISAANTRKLASSFSSPNDIYRGRLYIKYNRV